MWGEAAPGVSLPSAALLTVLGVPHLVKDRLDLRLHLHLPSPCVHLPGFLLLIRTPVLLDQGPNLVRYDLTLSSDMCRDPIPKESHAMN